MCVFLALLCVMCVARIHGTCVQKDPPPGVLVLAPGSKLVLTCRGQIMVNGATVNIGRNSVNTNRRRSRSVAPTTPENSVSKQTVGSTANYLYRSTSAQSAVTGENTNPRYTDTGSTAPPTTQGDPQTAVSRLLKSEPSWVDEEKNNADDYEEEQEEGEDGNRVTRGINSSPQWKWNGKTVGNGKRDWGEISLETEGATMTLSSARPSHSGKFSCHHTARERFSIKVIIADPPKIPSLSCYKKSPSSKICCESEIQKPAAMPFSSYLVLSKRPFQTVSNVSCSYSSQLSRYICEVKYDEEELRTNYKAYLCITSIAGNATSTMLSFAPMDILMPDPPSGVQAHEIEGHKTYMSVNWTYPKSWKPQDNYYSLVYELIYKPVKSSFHYEQKILRKTMRICITDVMPGVEYQIKVRTKEEFDGQWSDWSAPVSGRSWTGPSVVYTTLSTAFTDEESTFITEDPAPTEPTDEMSYHALWISGSFLLLSVILAVYIFRHKDRFMPKLHHLTATTQHSDSSQPPSPSPAAPEVQDLVTFAPSHYREPPLSNAGEAEEEDEEAQSAEERMEAMHFDNTSYFLLQRE